MYIVISNALGLDDSYDYVGDRFRMYFGADLTYDDHGRRRRRRRHRHNCVRRGAGRGGGGEGDGEGREGEVRE